MTTLILTIPQPAAAGMIKYLGTNVIVCTKGHSPSRPRQVPETLFYERKSLPGDGRFPTALDIEMIAGCLARIMVASPETIDSYAADIYRRADAFIVGTGIDALLFRTGPHLPHEMALYRIAKHYSLKVGIYEETSYFGRSLLFPGTDARSLKKALWQPEAPHRLDADQTAALAGNVELKNYYFGIYQPKRNRFRDLARSAFYSTAAVIKANLSGAPLAGTARSSDNPLRPSLVGALHYWRQNIAGVMAGERAFKHRLSPDAVYSSLDEDDVVFYGNYAPERTIFPDSYPYHDFLSAMRLLADFKKKIWREHPTQFRLPGRPYMLRGGFYKGPSFYDALQREGWLIGPLDYPSEAVLQSKAMIATLNGTIAFEAMLKRRPLIAFAKNWYLDLPNVSTAGERRFDLNYEPVDVAVDAFARTFPRIDFWTMRPDELDVLARSIELVRSQPSAPRKGNQP